MALAARVVHHSMSKEAVMASGMELKGTIAADGKVDSIKYGFYNDLHIKNKRFL